MPGIASKVFRQSYLLAACTAGLSASLWLAFKVRFDFAIAPEYLVHFDWMLVSLVAVKLILLLCLGQFGSLLSYFGFHDLGNFWLYAPFLRPWRWQVMNPDGYKTSGI